MAVMVHTTVIGSLIPTMSHRQAVAAFRTNQNPTEQVLCFINRW
jgi:hypothetical protein